MEMLDAFGNKCTLRVLLFKQISPEDFEEQSVSYTKQCLRELFSKTEQNPRVCERSLRKQKQMEKKGAKICWVLQGELNYSNHTDIVELEEKVCQLRQRIQKANNCAQGAKNRKGRHPRLSRGKRYTLEGGFCPFRSKAPEPPKFTMPRVFDPFQEITSKQLPDGTEDDVESENPGPSSSAKET